MIEPVTLYEYAATIDSVYDGDTVRANIDLGFGVWKLSESMRLLGINAPEMWGDTHDAAVAARDALRIRVADKLLWIRTVKPSVVSVPAIDKREKYGRFLATIWDVDGNVNDWLVEQGYAVRYMV